MQLPTLNLDAIHPSVYRQAPGLLSYAKATPRPDGALRYQCPATGSFVLVTDEPTLAGLTSRARIRCVDCGEMHMLRQDAGADASAGE
jgi:hypothetical protein